MTGFIHYDYQRVYASGLSKSEIALFFRLAIACGADNSCSVANITLAHWMTSSVQWICKAVKKLESAGFLKVERSVGGRGNKNTYHINSACNNGEGTNSVCEKSVCDEEKECLNAEKTVNKSAPINNKYKIIPRKEEKSINNETTSGFADVHRGGGIEMIKLKSYPVHAEDLQGYFPEVDRNTVINYLFYRNSNNWYRKDGSRIRPADIIRDFGAWLKRERRPGMFNREEENNREPDTAEMKWETLFA